MVYQYAWRVNKYPVDAQEAGEYIEEMHRQRGCVTAQTVLEASRDTGALLHPCFEWSDTAAAEAYRLEQARHLIGNLVAVKVEGEKPDNKHEGEVTRAFVSVSPAPSAARFVPIREAMANAVTRKTVLDNALSELRAFQRKYDTLTELQPVFAAINKLIG